MSSRTATDKADDEHLRSPRVEETAPSEVASDEFTFPRFVGMTGMVFAIIGSMFMFVSMARGVPVRVLYLMAVGLGLVMMLYHAARDADQQIRRAYGLFGVGLLVLGGLFALLPGGPDSQMGYRFLSIGFPSLLLGLLFVVCFVHHEEDETYRDKTLLLLLILGGLLSIGSLFTGIINPRFMVGTGMLMSLLGLAFLCAYVSNIGAAVGRGYQIALAIGAVGAVATLYAIGRAVIPDLFGMDKVAPYLVPSGLITIGVGLIFMAVSIALWSDNQFVVLARRELMAYFYSPIAYLVLFGLSVVGWFNYLHFLDVILGSMGTEFGAGGVPEPIVQLYIYRIWPVMTIVFVVPAITMRLLAEEQRTGTLEVLLTAPVSEWVVVLSKFFACFLFFMLLWVPWGLYLVALRSETGVDFDYRPLISFYIFLAASGAAFVSMGLFFSSLTRNQIIAGVLTFSGMLVLVVFHLLPSMEMVGEQWKLIFRKMSFLDQWLAALSGRLLISDLILYLSLTVFWLFLTTKVLEARKWQ